jgi:hypothetical protein
MMHLTHRVEVKSSWLKINPFVIDQKLSCPFNYIYRFIMCFVKMGFYFSNSLRLILFSIMMTSLL